MRPIHHLAILSALAAWPAYALDDTGSEASTAPTLSDAAIRKAIIQESIDSYPGNCPCPYNSARNGSRCGGRSAYSRAGGYAPLCYPRDVSDDMVARYRESHTTH